MRLNAVDGLAQLTFLVHGAMERRAAELELSMIQVRLLGVLRDRTPTMKELAVLLGLDKSSVTGLIDRAERRGLVERLPSTADGRAVHVALTRAGRGLITKAATRFEGDVTELLAHLPAKDRATMTSLISRLLVADAAERGVELFP